MRKGHLITGAVATLIPVLVISGIINIEGVLIVLWPSYIFLVSLGGKIEPTSIATFIVTVSVAVNIGYYILIYWMVGMLKRKILNGL